MSPVSMFLYPKLLMREVKLSGREMDNYIFEEKVNTRPKPFFSLHSDPKAKTKDYIYGETWNIKDFPLKIRFLRQKHFRV